MYVYYTAAAIIAYLVGVGCVLEHDQIIYVVLFTSIPLAVSIGGMFFVRTALERLGWRGMFSLRKQSWAFVLGDAIALPIAFFFLIWSYRSQEMNSFFDSRGWTLLALIIGVIVGFVFRIVDSPRYVDASRATALKSPTKIWHDLVVYPVLTGLLVWGGIPLLSNGVSLFEWCLIVSLLLWLAFGVRDILRPPVISEQHPRWNVKAFRPS